IICFIIFKKQRYTMIILENIANSICYLTFFIFFSWDKVYYIMKKQGDNTSVYFIVYEKNEICFIHNSYTCGCKLKKRKENDENTIEKYILFYKFCSTLFIMDDYGKWKYFNSKSKISLIK
ncbi:hypothetical protein BCR36DRAFT_281085, partial [Piromyces finnis]